MAVENTSSNALAEKFSDLIDIGIAESQCGPCCIDCGPVYVLASVETFGKFAEAYFIDSVLPAIKKCCTETCIKELTTIVGEDAFALFLDIGIMNYSSIDGGKSYLCDLLEYAKKNNATVEDIIALVQVALDKGVVIYCDGEDKVTASVETFLKYAEGQEVINTGVDKCCLTITASVETYLQYEEAVTPIPA